MTYISILKPCSSTFPLEKQDLYCSKILKSAIIKQLCNFHYIRRIALQRVQTNNIKHQLHFRMLLHFSANMKLCKTSKNKLSTSSPS